MMTSVICPVEFITFFIMILIDEDIMIIIIVLHLFFPDIVSKQVVFRLHIHNNIHTIYHLLIWNESANRGSSILLHSVSWQVTTNPQIK